jgi:hypothetical protein
MVAVTRPAVVSVSQSLGVSFGAPRPTGDEQGAALIVSLMAITLMMALGTALVLTTMTERRIAGNYRDGIEALYAAGAAVEWSMQDVLAVSDWNRIIDGSVTSRFVDGVHRGPRMPDGQALDLRRTTNTVRCGKATACSDRDMDEVTEERPWGRNNPRWQLYAHGQLSNMVESSASPAYVVVWMADDPSESDDNPLVDGLPKAGCRASEPSCANLGSVNLGRVNLGRGVMAMRVHAYGRDGVVRVVEVTLARSDTGEARLLAWREGH